MEFLNGHIGRDTISVAGLSVPNQTAGFVYDAAWNGDGIDSGLIGLAYPGLTSEYNTSSPTEDNNTTRVSYNPFFFTAVNQGLVEPYFSLALDRGTFEHQANASFDSPLGTLAFGGVAPANVTDTASTIKVEKVTSKTRGKIFAFYAVNAEFSYPNSNSSLNLTSTPILDSGTTLNVLDNDLAKDYNQQFAKFDENLGYWVVDCDIDPSTIPTLSVKLGGATFTIDGKDQVLPQTDENGNQTCISGTQPGGTEANGDTLVLGDTFFHNIVATFNIKENQVTVTQRQPY